MATGRIGYAMERALFYAKSAAAFVDTTEKQQRDFGIAPLFPIVAGGLGSYPSSKMHAFSDDWAVGGGLEYAISKN